MTHPKAKAKLTAGGVGLFLTLLAGVFGVLGSLGMFVLIDVLGVSGSDYAFLVSSRGIQIGFFVTAILYIVYRGDIELFINYQMPGREGLAWIVAIPAVLITFGILSEPVLSAVGIEREMGGLNVDPTATIGLFVVFFITSWLFAAPAEELLFRGVIQARLRETFGAVSGVVCGAFLFALFHVLLGLLEGLSASGIVFWGWESLIAGILWGAAYERTNNLIVPSIAHASIWTIPFFIL